MSITKSVNKMFINCYLRVFERVQIICKVINSSRRQLSWYRHFFFQISPNVVDISLCLQSAGITHGCKHERFNSTLICAYANNLHFNTQFVQQSFEEHCATGKTMNVKHSYRIHENTVGNGRNVIVILGNHVAVSINPFAWILFEFHQCIADCCWCGQSGWSDITTDIYTWDFWIRSSIVDCSNNVIQIQRRFGIIEIILPSNRIGSFRDCSL